MGRQYTVVIVVGKKKTTKHLWFPKADQETCVFFNGVLKKVCLLSSVGTLHEGGLCSFSLTFALPSSAQLPSVEVSPSLNNPSPLPPSARCLLLSFLRWRFQGGGKGEE